MDDKSKNVFKHLLVATILCTSQLVPQALIGFNYNFITLKILF